MQIKRRTLSCAEDVVRVMRNVFGEPLQEELWCVSLDARNRVLDYKMISRGLADRSHVHPREVFRFLFLSGPVIRFMLVHNHPSGDPTPSAQDKVVTEKMKQAGESLGLELLDHVIISSWCEHVHEEVPPFYSCI